MTQTGDCATGTPRPRFNKHPGLIRKWHGRALREDRDKPSRLQAHFTIRSLRRKRQPMDHPLMATSSLRRCNDVVLASSSVDLRRGELAADVYADMRRSLPRQHSCRANGIFNALLPDGGWRRAISSPSAKISVRSAFWRVSLRRTGRRCATQCVDNAASAVQVPHQQWLPQLTVRHCHSRLRPMQLPLGRDVAIVSRCRSSQARRGKTRQDRRASRTLGGMRPFC